MQRLSIRPRILNSPGGYQAVNVSNRRPVAATACLFIAAIACIPLSRTDPTAAGPKAIRLTPAGMTQTDAIRLTGDIITATLPHLTRATLSAAGVLLQSGRGASWEVTCTDAHGVDRATIVWDAMNSRIASYGSSQQDRKGHPVTTAHDAGHIANRWLTTLARYGWTGPWVAHTIYSFGDHVWKAGYTSKHSEAYVLIDGKSGRLLQAHFEETKSSFRRSDPRLCAWSQ